MNKCLLQKIVTSLKKWPLTKLVLLTTGYLWNFLVSSFTGPMNFLSLFKKLLQAMQHNTKCFYIFLFIGCVLCFFQLPQCKNNTFFFLQGLKSSTIFPFLVFYFVHHFSVFLNIFCHFFSLSHKYANCLDFGEIIPNFDLILSIYALQLISFLKKKNIYKYDKVW